MPQSSECAEENLNDIFSAVKHVAPSLHQAGTFPAKVFDALVDHLTRDKVVNSLETGSGASTLIFSHLSRNHTVFARDDGNGSIRNIQQLPLLRAESVTFIEGPTQKTLPVYQFKEPLQAALIDGPHGFPFPDLEYYYIYPHLGSGALLIVDDINIRSVYKLFSFLKVDKMFRLEQVVNSTAFFRRTAAPTFDPFGDGWWEQAYNQIPSKPYLARYMIKRAMPAALLDLLRQMRR